MKTILILLLAVSSIFAQVRKKQTVDGTTDDFIDGVHYTQAVNQTQGIALANLLSNI